MDRLAFGVRELKFADDATTRTFAGYGSVFDTVDDYGDVVVKGAFKKTLREAKKNGRWPKMLAQHGGGWSGTGQDLMPIGVWTKLEEDDKGLYVEGKLSDTPRGNEAYVLLKDGALDAMSIGYTAKTYTVGTKPEEPRRTLKEIELWEVSLVTFPANAQALVDQVKACERIKTIREFETFLRDVGGYSAEAAKAIASGGFKAKTEPRDGDVAAGFDSVLGALRQANS